MIEGLLGLDLADLERHKLIAEIEQLNAQRDKNVAEKLKLVGETDLVERNNKNLAAMYGQSRVYTFYDPVRELTVYKAIEEISMWARRDPIQPIKVVFTSPGGNVLDGIALYDFLVALRKAGTKIDVTALGWAASMSAILLQAGEERIMGRNSYLLIHEVSDVVGGNMSVIEDQVEFAKRLQETLLDILSERSKLTKRQIKAKWKKKDWWLDAKEALEFGFIDTIQ